ncbi:MAG: hypothetical protein ACR2M0_00910 [Chloroflexia bacterium]
MPASQSEAANSAPVRSSPPPWLPHLLALLAYFALAVLFTWPTVLHFDSRITGNLIPDRDQNLWNLWWVKESLLVRHTNPFHTDLLYYPYGVDLYLHDLALPNGLIGLVPQLLLGVFAAYNTVVLACYTLTGYAAYRVVLYCLGRPAGSGPPPPSGAVRHIAAFLGGVVFAFTAYSLDAQKQINILALQWVPFAAEAWMRAWDTASRRWAALAAVYLVLAMLVNAYYEVLLVIFMAAYTLHSIPRRRSLRIIPAFAVTALLLGGPYAYGAWQSTQTERITVEATGQQGVHAADLLSFVLPPPDHPWLGENAPWWQGLDPNTVPGYLGLGVASILLALLGLWRLRRRRREAVFWGLLALGGATCAMGTTLQVAGVRDFGGHSIPLPFALLGRLPILNLIGKVERFEVLTLLAMAVLGGWACTGLLARARRLPRVGVPLVAAALFAALVIELPMYARSDRRVTLPPGPSALAAAPGQGPILELPFVQVRVAPLSKRMLYQTVHGRPILAGYISRTVENRNALPCSPLYRFVKPLALGDSDIVSPATNAEPLAVLHSYGIAYIVSYARVDVETGTLVSGDEANALGALIKQVADGPPIYTDDLMAIYRPKAGAALSAPSLQIGDSWHDLETQAGRPFRWIDGGQATICVETPAPVRLSLAARVTSFARPRTLEVWQGNNRVYTATVPAGDFVSLQTPMLDFPSGTTELRLVVPEGGQSPGGADTRTLSLGLQDVHFAP